MTARRTRRGRGSSIRAVVQTTVVLVLGMVFLRVVGEPVSGMTACSVVLAGALLILIVSRLSMPLATVWPSPEQPSGSSWMGVHPQARRLGRLVQAAQSRDDPELRQELADELGRRLVARHGADPADPLAEAEQVAPDLAKAIRTPGRLGTARLTRLLDQLEDL